MKPEIALLGNPNCGKTTLFNRLTGSHHAVGNRIGVTVSQTAGECHIRPARIVDLPGVYSLCGSTAEETVAGDYLQTSRPDIILNILDATNLERSLLLTTQLAETGIPMIVALNMTDLLEKNGDSIDTAGLARRLGAPVFPISASKNTGLSTLMKDLPTHCKPLSFSSEEGRRRFIQDTTKAVLQKNGADQTFAITKKLDRIFLHPILSIPIFCLIMFFVFQITFGGVTASLSDWLGAFINGNAAQTLANLLSSLSAPVFLHSLLIDGILRSVGNVASFLPQIVMLFLLLSLLEDSGYMARTAFILDGIFRRFGLSGKAVLPLILGFGCSVPAIMSTRTLSSQKEQRIALFMIPFMSCSARMPVYALFCAAFFPQNAALVVFSLYFTGIVFGLLCGLVFSKYCFRGEADAFVLELPQYRLPTPKTILVHIYEKITEFLKKAGSILFLAGIVIWLLESFNFALHMVSDGENSILGHLGRFIAPIFTPCGFGNWQSAVSLLSGLAAKEAVLSSLSILSGGAPLSVLLADLFTPASALSFMVFTLLYTPCVSAVSAMAEEMKSARLTFLSCLLQFTVAWCCACIVYQIILLINI